MHRILIIDDNAALCRTIGKMVSSMGMLAEYAHTLQSGMEKADAGNFDVIFLDVHLPDGSGLDGISRLRTGSFPPEVIIITAYGNRHGAETAINSGVWDYIEKSASLQNIKLALMRATEYRDNKRKSTTRQALHREEIIGSSPEISSCLNQLGLCTRTVSPVLISGETGTGKELFARALHDNSPESKNNFVVVDCAALPDHLVESILFGHIKGSFTGAHTDHQGLIAQADGGTLFLDEVGELPLSVQKKLLRVTQEKYFRKVGGKQEETSDFRLVCATHRDLSEMVEQGRFRRDLYFRIRAMQIELPPLRNRPDDIPMLVKHYFNRISKQTGTPLRNISPDFMETLAAYSWPGNVRELFSTLDRVLAVSTNEPLLFPKHLPLPIRTAAIRHKINASPAVLPTNDPDAAPEDTALQLPMKDFMETMKRRYVASLMKSSEGSIKTACKKSGLSRSHLYQLLKKYKI